MSIVFETIGTCTARAVRRVEGYTAVARGLHGRLDADVCVCDQHIDLGVDYVTAAGLTSYICPPNPALAEHPTVCGTATRYTSAAVQ
ncbi:hypothetical protein [Nocardia sp. CNY236]|uniref:hypothetical protein n=1 Tax=Nocardia sp. CNY236 TaxID=1169152 RepID=UPI00041E8096|nr:hypothetical protein [Nocardia sp. CNY236]